MYPQSPASPCNFISLAEEEDEEDNADDKDSDIEDYAAKCVLFPSRGAASTSKGSRSNTPTEELTKDKVSEKL